MKIPTIPLWAFPTSILKIPYVALFLLLGLFQSNANESARSFFNFNPSIQTADYVTIQQLQLPPQTDQDSVLVKLGNKANEFNKHNPIEKIYLHTDRNLFTSGEIVWYSGYAVLGPLHQFSMASKVLHVDIIDPNNTILVSQTHEMVNGKANGSIALPKHLLSGNYQIRAYTDWMRNFEHDFFFTKTITIVGASEMPLSHQMDKDITDLQFFPEGGHWITGLMGRVGYKAIGPDGLDKEIRGYIKNTQGNPVGILETIDRGSGYFDLKPSLGEQYIAVLEDGSEHPLPKVMEQGYTISVDNLNEVSTIVKVQASATLKDRPFYIVGQINNYIHYQGKFEFGSADIVKLAIPKDQLPSGVMSITLFDEEMRPWCERVVFINNEHTLTFNLDIRPEQLSRRNEVTLNIHVSDPNGDPVSTDLSLAITDARQVVNDINSGNMVSHLLMQSEIKGNIQDPGALFRHKERATIHAIDLVMLTHGWRKFPWRDLEKSANRPKQFQFSKGLRISGLARGLYDNPLKRITLNGIAKSRDFYGMFTAKTSKEGTFAIPNFNFRDTTKIVFSAYDHKNRQLNLKMVLDSNQIKPPTPNFLNPRLISNQETEKYFADYYTRENRYSYNDYENSTKLDEVVVTEKIAEKIERTAPSALGQTPDATLFTKDTREAGLNLVDYIARLGGVTVHGSFPRYNVRVRGGLNGPPLWVLNGVPVSNIPVQQQEGGLPGGSVPNQIATMDISNVERVELLKGPSAAIWGSRGAGGVILVYTKRGGGKEIVLSPEFDIIGHAIDREFYTPDYSVKLDKHSFPDHRTTLYWNPNIRTDQNGNASLRFYNSDDAKQIQLSIEGLSDQGLPGTYLETFSGIDIP